MKLVVVCEVCGTGIVIHRGDPVALPFGMKLAELVITALESHQCLDAQTGRTK